MSTASALIEQAFEKLSQRSGFTDRPNQRQLALLISDLIEQERTGAFEAPTGLGKSLAALIPALANAIVNDKRVVVATYTNVLAEQYWRNDLPLALSLFEATEIRAQLLMGRQRYACLVAMGEHAPSDVSAFRQLAEIGHEAEFRRYATGPKRQLSQLWQKVATPPMCPGRFCPEYDACFYYKARRGAEKANLIITNHSVVIQHALMMGKEGEGEGLLGDYDFLILDEAHDFAQAAQNGLEFELSQPRLAMLAAISTRIEAAVQPLADAADEGAAWMRACARFRDSIEKAQFELATYGLELAETGILAATPTEVFEHPQVQNHRADEGSIGAERITQRVSAVCAAFANGTQDRIKKWREAHPDRGRAIAELVRSYLNYVSEFGDLATTLVQPQGVAVSYAGRSSGDAILRRDVIGLSDPLREMIWSRKPYVCLSATLALDGHFEFFKRTTGAAPEFEELLPTPFDFVHQAALYLPPEGAVPDPTLARKRGSEEEYYFAVARELSHLIRACEGRTLALFHSRREMEGVMEHLDLPAELPVYMQLRSGASHVGERFVRNVNASLFALRSFWTGFDAPGETLSCVALVRVPFEVPTDPPQIARMAYLQTQGIDAFREHTLPLAKMLMRQGAGRLIRRDTDKGIIALLDPRLQTKNYGEEILQNLPPGMRVFRDARDAAGWIGLGT